MEDSKFSDAQKAFILMQNTIEAPAHHRDRRAETPTSGDPGSGLGSLLKLLGRF